MPEEGYAKSLSSDDEFLVQIMSEINQTFSTWISSTWRFVVLVSYRLSYDPRVELIKKMRLVQ